MINKNWKSHWKLVAMNKQITPEHMIERCLLQALTAKSQNKVEIAQSLLRAAFTPITNKNKLANGRRAFDTLEHRLVFRMFYSPKTIFGLDVSLFMDEEGIKEYTNLLKAIPKRDYAANEPDYLFLFVRQDISKEQQAVQASHAAFKAGCNASSNVDPSEVHFVLVGVSDEQELADTADMLKANNVACHEFHEPDLGDSLTAVATLPMKQHKKRFLKEFKLLKFD